MAGVKGRSGGARPNSGGKRPGAGRKKRVAAEQPGTVQATPAPAAAAAAVAAKVPEVPVESEPDPTVYDDPLTFLRDVVNNRKMADSARIAAARTWAVLEKRGIVAPPRKGKKETQKDAAAEEATGGGIFGMRRPPRLVSSGT